MPTLDELKAQHPEWCWNCGNWFDHPDGIHTCVDHTIITALTTAKLEDEARIAELEAREQRTRDYYECKMSGSERLSRIESQLTAEQQAHAATKEELRKADEALIQHGYHRQGIPDLGVPHCGYDPEEGVGCDCGFQPRLEAALARQQARNAQGAEGGEHE